MKNILTLSLIIILSACSTFHYPRRLVSDAERGVTLFRWVDSIKDSLDQPLPITINGFKAGEIIEESRPYTSGMRKFFGAAFSHEVAYTDSKTKKRHILWTYADYAWLGKLSQGPEQEIIRLYHGHQLIFLRFYVTELNIQTGKIRGYRLSRSEYDKLAK
ncbi:MAG: hypothetical protein IPP68_07435 [Elusimicrobia bacterium]|nr:hypothetical protein [Elusimicrobiota bacterium]